jgi:hypothetical protein
MYKIKTLKKGDLVMKKIFLTLFASFFLLVGVASASIFTLNFDASLDLEDNVFGFQAEYSLDSGSLLSTEDLLIQYTKTFDITVPGIVDAPNSAVPGIDYSAIGGDPSIDWDISVANNAATGGSNVIVGYTLGSEPLVTGTILTIDLLEDSLLLSNWALSDAFGTPGAFEEGVNFKVDFDVASNTYTVKPVPIPPALLLFGSGIIGMLGLRRKFNK